MIILTCYSSSVFYDKKKKKTLVNNVTVKDV